MLATEVDLETLVDKTVFGAAAAEIRRRARPCIHLLAGGPPDQLGRTRLGGMPDLATGFAWPRTSQGEPLAFFAQLNLAEIAAVIGPSELPGSGLLSVFAGGDFGRNEVIDVCVHNTNVEGELVQTPPPKDLPKHLKLNAVSPRFIPGLMLPMGDWAFTESIQRTAPDGDFETFLEQAYACPEGAIGQLFGYANDGQDDLHHAVAFRQIGRPDQEQFLIWEDWPAWEKAKQIETRMAKGHIDRPWSSADDDNVRWILANRATITERTEQLRVLLGIRSNKAMNLWVNDADPTYFLIDAHALRVGDFSQAAAIAPQS